MDQDRCVFFADAKKALTAGFRPSGYCQRMKHQAYMGDLNAYGKKFGLKFQVLGGGDPIMDILEFKLIPAKDMIEDWMDDWTEDELNSKRLVKIIINGTDLIDIIRAIELPYQTNAGYPENAGDYGHNTDEYMEWQLRDALQPSTYPYDCGIELFCCPDCGLGGCWSVICHLRKENGVIIMKDFHHNHRNWEYNLCYQFSEENYKNEVAKLNNT